MIGDVCVVVVVVKSFLCPHCLASFLGFCEVYSYELPAGNCHDTQRTVSVSALTGRQNLENVHNKKQNN